MRSGCPEAIVESGWLGPSSRGLPSKGLVRSRTPDLTTHRSISGGPSRMPSGFRHRDRADDRDRCASNRGDPGTYGVGSGSGESLGL